MKILLLEDLDTFADAVAQGLEARRSELGEVVLIRIPTELAFRRRLDELVREDFDVAIFDVMIAWCMPEETLTKEGANPPEEVLREFALDARWRSGIRCKNIFERELNNRHLPPVPSIYYTVLESSYLQTESDDKTPIVTKQGEIDFLVEAIRQVTS
jgi:hypothetical protein